MKSRDSLERLGTKRRLAIDKQWIAWQELSKADIA
jgi:hypothetical protein